MDSIVIPEALKAYLPIVKGILVALAILVVGWVASKWASKLTRRAFSHRKLDQALALFIASIIQYLVLAAAIITALGAVGLQTTSLIAVFASAGLAIGLALQGSLGNFASGVMILFFRPFNLGDKVTVGGHTGVVSDIGLFATTLITADNETIIVGNSAVTGGSIINFTARGTLRGQINVTLAGGVDTVEAGAILLTAAQHAPLVLPEPAPAVAFVGFGTRGIEFTVYPWANAVDYLGMMHNVRQAMYQDLAAAGIELAPNQLVVAPAPAR